MGFVNGLKWVQKCVKSGFLGAKVGQNAPKPIFAPTLNPFWHTHENPLFTQFKGGGNCFPKRALRQSRPSISRIRFRGARFQTPSSVSFSVLTEFGGASSVSSFQPIICV